MLTFTAYEIVKSRQLLADARATRTASHVDAVAMRRPKRARGWGLVLAAVPFRATRRSCCAA